MPFRIQVLLAGVICAALGTLARPFWGLLFLIFLTFVRFQDGRPNMAQLHVPMIMTWAVIAATCGRPAVIAGRLGFVLRKQALLIALLGLMVPAALANGWTPYSAYQVGETFTIFLVTSLILIWVGTPKRLELTLWVMLAAGVHYIRMVILSPRFMQEEIAGAGFERLSFRNTVNFGNPNFLAVLMVILGFLALALLAHEHRRWMKVLLGATVCGYLYVFFRCQSRGATLGLAAGLLVFWFMQKRKILVAAVAVAGAVIGLVYLAPAGYLERLQTITNYQEDKSATGRLEMWAIAADEIAASPIFGIGPGNFEPRHPQMGEHNAYLQVATEVGVLGLPLYLALLLSGFRSAWAARRLAGPRAKDLPLLRGVSEGLLCALTAILVQGFFTGFAFREFVYITLTLTYCARVIAEGAELPEETVVPQVAAPAGLARA